MTFLAPALDEAIALFITYCKAKGLAPRTLETYSASLGALNGFLLASDCGCDLPGPRELRGFIASLLDSGLARTSVAIHARSVGAFFGFLTREGLLAENPMRAVEVPRVPLTFPAVLDVAQMRRLVLACGRSTWPEKRNRAIVLTFLDTGIRLGELVHCDLQDADLASRVLRIREAKGGKERQVFMGSVLYQALRQWIEARGTGCGCEALFTTRQGERLDHRNVERILQRLAVRATLDDVRVTPHILRHTFATHYITNGGDPFSLQRILGHSDIKTTMIYVNHSGLGLREAHAKASPVDRL